jgi:hypothetical protein
MRVKAEEKTSMRTRLLYCVPYTDFGKLLERANDLVGKPLEDEPALTVKRIVHFQVVRQQAFWHMWLLVKVVDTKKPRERVVIEEEKDIVRVSNPDDWGWKKD